jgi:sugar O-acyltransferase (sialic acid O-acetyltransferase NeuD family)
MNNERTKANQMPPKIILWGAIGQAKLIKDVIDYSDSRVIAVFDSNPNFSSPFSDVPIYHGWEQFLEWVKDQDKSELGFVVGTAMEGRKFRLELYDRFCELGLRPVTLIHPSAIIARNAVIGEGSQIMAGTVIGPEAKLGKLCIINTKASVDHENVFEDGVEIAPGATLCGLVSVGANSWIAAGATVLPRIKIGRNCIVGAGSLVNKNVPDQTTVVGVPAKPLARK